MMLSALVLSAVISQALAFTRTIGPPGDYRFVRASEACDGSNPKKFEFGECSVLIACIYDNIDEAFKASLSSGTNIASLLPTILVLIGSRPIELVELAFLSPHRAIAACCFTIGLPSSLFRQLRPLRLHPLNSNVTELRVRERTVFLPSICRSRSGHLLTKLTVDLVIVTLLGIMLWRNIYVTSFTTVPWRCEYTYLLPACFPMVTPIACISWLLIAVLLLYFMKESITIYNPANPAFKYSILGLMALPYTVTMNHPFEEGLNVPALPGYTTEEEMGTISTSNNNGDETPGDTEEETDLVTTSYPTRIERPRYQGSTSSRSPIVTKTQRRETISMPAGSNCVTIRITMPSSFGWRSWRSYEAVIETMAVGIYLYATFVLTSLLFLNADKAIVYAIVMAICLSFVRILTVLF
ncbi:MAG: hypothetical protein Q9193_005484 [Seirophora villosa]